MLLFKNVSTASGGQKFGSPCDHDLCLSGVFHSGIGPRQKEPERPDRLVWASDLLDPLGARPHLGARVHTVLCETPSQGLKKFSVGNEDLAFPAGADDDRWRFLGVAAGVPDLERRNQS